MHSFFYQIIHFLPNLSLTALSEDSSYVTLLTSTLLRYIDIQANVPILSVQFNEFWKCIHPCDHYHNKNVGHFHLSSTFHMPLCSQPPTPTNVGLRQPLSASCHSRLVLPFQEFHINEIIRHILCFHKIKGKARETPSKRMGVTDVNVLTSWPWHSPIWRQSQCGVLELRLPSSVALCVHYHFPALILGAALPLAHICQLGK